MDDFVRCAALVASPLTEASARVQADAWLAAFRSDGAAWGVALGVLRAPSAPPEVRLQAASLLGWKVRHQLAQLQPPERQAQLVDALTQLAATTAPRDAAARAVLASLAALAIRCAAWERPLDDLALRLDQDRLLEFLTLLPQECEDALAAAQPASAEQGWAIRARGHSWSPGVLAWLSGLHPLTSSSSGGGGSPQQQQQQQQQQEAAAAAGEGRAVAVLRAFAAWVRWGCLQHADEQHARQLAGLAAELLFAPDPAARLPYSPAALAAAVDAASEVVEHSPPALHPLLAGMAAALPPRVAQVAAAGEASAAEDLAHVFSLFVSTHCALCGAAGPQGQALRQGLLQLLSLPLCGEGEAGPALPAAGALADLLEHQLAAERRQGSGGGEAAEDGGQQGGGPEAGPMSREERAAFAACALRVLLAQLAPAGAAPPAAPPGAQAARSAPQELVPHALRQEAAPALDLLGELLGPDAALDLLAAHALHAAERHGARSVAANAALASSLHALRGLAGLLEGRCAERCPGDPPPGWLAALLQLYQLVPSAEGSAPPLPRLHADFLGGYAALGGALTPLLQAAGGQQAAAVGQLVLNTALPALRDARHAPAAAGGGVEDAAECAAAALRTLCSACAATGTPASAPLLAGLEGGLEALGTPRSHAQLEARCHLATALVHALHAVPPGDAHLAHAAHAALARQLLQPLQAALEAAHSALGPAPASPQAAQQAQQQLRAALPVLHTALRTLHALLNGLESYAGHEGEGGGGAAAGATRAAVGALLSAWPRLAQVCCWPGGGEGGGGGGGEGGALLELRHEAAHCLCCAMALDPQAFLSALPAYADVAASACRQSGGGALLRPLCQALDAYGAQPHLQPPLLRSAAAALEAGAARGLGAPRGGDADPEAAAALLALLAACLRAARRWRQLDAATGDELLRLLGWGVPLAAAGAGSHQRDVCLGALGALGSLLALALERGWPLHAPLLGWAAAEGPTLLQGLLAALLSLNSAAHLPRVVSLMGDVALLAASLALGQAQAAGGSQPPSPHAVCAAAGAHVAAWQSAAQQALVAGGVLQQGAAAAVLALWDWQPVLAAATAQLVQQQGGGGGGGGGLGSAEVRRAMQRSARLLADTARRGVQAGG